MISIILQLKLLKILSINFLLVSKKAKCKIYLTGTLGSTYVMQITSGNEVKKILEQKKDDVLEERDDLIEEFVYVIMKHHLVLSNVTLIRGV